MKLSELLEEKRIALDIRAKNKTDLIGSLVDLVINGFDRDTVLESVIEREKLGSTGIGHGVAIPHIRLDSVQRPAVAFGRSAEPVDFDSIDEEPCSLFFLVVGPSNQEFQEEYLKVMAKISRLMRISALRERLMTAVTPDEVLKAIMEEEA